MTTGLVLCWSPLCCENNPEPSTLATDPLSPVSCELEPPWIRLVCPAHPKDASLDWDLAKSTPQTCCAHQTIPEPFLLSATAIRGYSFHERVHMVSNNGLIGSTCQSNIHMDGRTQSFPAEHCPNHHTVSAGLPSSHNASWFQVFSR